MNNINKLCKDTTRKQKDAIAYTVNVASEALYTGQL
jgi:hypothetical protein